MKRRILSFAALALLLCLTLCSCTRGENAASVPAVQSIVDWETITARITPERLARYGWYTDMETLPADARELGCVLFSNYDPAVADSFAAVPFQFTVTYGMEVGFEEPVYTLFWSDNGSDTYYACTCADDLTLLSEEGSWFLPEDRRTAVHTALSHCRELLFGEE